MNATRPCIGISAIGIYEPSRKLTNQWFGSSISRKFVHHTGTESRLLSSHDEVAMGVRAVEKLRQETQCDLRDCAAVVFVSPSFIPTTMARKFLSPELQRRERLSLAANRLASELGIENRPLYGINWFCSGYSKALSLVQRQVVPALSNHQQGLQQQQFVLVVTAGRISRITDYDCSQTAPLFGDMATATLISRLDSRKYPVHFKVTHAFAEKQPAPGVFFNFELRQNVLMPGDDDSRAQANERLVFSLDGLGIADVAPRAMANAVAKSLQARRLRAADVRFVVPHQAGTGIVRLASMKLEQLGVQGEVVNGITGQVGNVSSSSIPFALKQTWQKLEGLIACPTAAVGAPGVAEVSQGCILLEAVGNGPGVARAA